MDTTASDAGEDVTRRLTTVAGPLPLYGCPGEDLGLGVRAPLTDTLDPPSRRGDLDSLGRSPLPIVGLKEAGKVILYACDNATASAMTNACEP